MIERLVYVSPLVSAVASVIGLAAILLVWKQLADYLRWNKLHAAFTYFPNPLELDRLENDLDELLRFWRRPIEEKLTDLEIKALYSVERLTPAEVAQLKADNGMMDLSDADAAKRLMTAGRKLKIYLNLIETYCTAINIGVVDAYTAQKVFHHKFIRHWTKTEPFIKTVREAQNAPTVLREFEQVIDAWRQLGPTKARY